jgi:hypothetical protein
MVTFVVFIVVFIVAIVLVSILSSSSGGELSGAIGAFLIILISSFAMGAGFNFGYKWALRLHYKGEIHVSHTENPVCTVYYQSPDKDAKIKQIKATYCE